MKTDNKLKGRDLINIGIYAAIYFVILFAVAMLGMIPIFLPLLSVLVPILGGIPFMLFLTKVKKPGNAGTINYRPVLAHPGGPEDRKHVPRQYRTWTGYL